MGHAFEALQVGCVLAQIAFFEACSCNGQLGTMIELGSSVVQRVDAGARFEMQVSAEVDSLKDVSEKGGNVVDVDFMVGSFVLLGGDEQVLGEACLIETENCIGRF